MGDCARQKKGIPQNCAVCEGVTPEVYEKCQKRKE